MFATALKSRAGLTLSHMYTYDNSAADDFENISRQKLLRIIFLIELKTLWQKGEIAHYEQFLLLPKCFQKSAAAEVSTFVYMWESVK